MGTPEEDDRAWTEQLGSVYTAESVSRLLEREIDDVERDPRLLRLTMRSGRIGYPVFQFDGRSQLTGVGDVVEILLPAGISPWTIASWLRSPQTNYDGREFLDLIVAGELDTVLDHAHVFARSWGWPPSRNT